MPGFVIGEARAEQHAAGIAVIYNDAATKTTAIWNEATVDAANRAAWITERQSAGFPVLVALDGDAVLGYASYGPFRPFEGYKHTVEHSVYVRPDLRGGGVGTALLQSVIDHARSAGHHVMVAAISADNGGSIRLHARLGFVETGRMPEVGTKFGRWLDLVLMQIQL